MNVPILPRVAGWVFALCFLCICASSLVPASSAQKKPLDMIGYGTATTAGKAKRNARIDLKLKLDGLPNGDSKLTTAEAVGYDCEQGVLWHCKARLRTSH